MGIALLDIAHRIFALLVERQIITDEEVTALYEKAAKAHGALTHPANIEAGELLAWVAKERARKFR